MLKVPDNNELITLDGTGLQLWVELAVPVTLANVCVRLAARYGVEPDQIALDLGPVLDDLEGRELVHRLAA